MREKIFVSYSHKDSKWRDLLLGQLSSGIYREAFKVWSDKELQAGDNWEQVIQDNIATARIALLLVSRNFLKSDFIITKELPAILQFNEASMNAPESLRVWWIPLEEITKQELETAGLDKFQAAVAEPQKPLRAMKRKQLDGEITKLSSKLLEELKVLTNVSADARDQFKMDVRRALSDSPTVIGEALAPGDYSMLYRAERRGVEVAVKALIPLPGHEWMADDFVERAKLVCDVKNATAIQIREVVNKAVKCVVMEFVGAPTLKAQLGQQGSLPSTQVADVLAQLADLAADLHQMKGQPIIGPIRPSHVHYGQQKIRIALVHIANETLKSGLQRPMVPLDPDAFTYLVPERYFGEKIDWRTDQYFLGLLGLELLQGRPPVEVYAFSDLENKRKFFDAPREYFGELPERNPALSFILTKMLEREPQNRWASMSELADPLHEVAKGNVPNTVKKLAAEHYKRELSNNREFFASFYEALFDSPEIRDMFVRRNVVMDRQYQKLDSAVRSLWYFNPSIEPTSLDDQVKLHGEFGLKADHFGSFKKAFMTALLDAKITNPYARDAWRAILDPALDFMKAKLAETRETCA
jgi:serine/threonine protein kinase